MKKIGYVLVLALFACLINIGVKASYRNNYFKDLNTHNIKDKYDYESLLNIKMLCTYDFCDYVDLELADKGISIFTNRYLNTIQDEEVKNTLKVKGITITKVVFE